MRYSKQYLNLFPIMTFCDNHSLIFAIICDFGISYFIRPSGFFGPLYEAVNDKFFSHQITDRSLPTMSCNGAHPYSRDD